MTGLVREARRSVSSSSEGERRWARASRHLFAATALAALVGACGARSSLYEQEGGATSQGGSGGEGGAAGGQGGGGPCLEGAAVPCGSKVGACVAGTQTCSGGAFGPCEGAVGPVPETCNGVDDDCNGAVDEDFDVGLACDGPDSDACQDDTVTCAGCSSGQDEIEVCNGVDDDCDGVVDADCEVGGCQPSLVVVEVVKSAPRCFVDAVQPRSEGKLDFPCAGGPVSATFGPISFSGMVNGGVIALDASTTFDWSDGCKWTSSQTITGNLLSGSLEYTYAEMPIQGVSCQPPCSAQGTIAVVW